MIRSRRTKIALACAPFVVCALVAASYPVTGWLGRWQVKRHLAGLEAAGYAVDPEKYYVPSKSPDDDVLQHPAMIRERDDPKLARVYDREPKIPGLARRQPRVNAALAEENDLRLWLDPPPADERAAAEQLLAELADAIRRMDEIRPALERREAAWPLEYSTHFLTGETGIPNVVSGQFLLKRLVQFQAELALIQLADEDSSSAAIGVTSMLEICRVFLDSRPNLVSLLLADVTLRATEQLLREGVRRGMWTADQLVDFDKHLGTLDPQASASRCFRGEVAFARWEAERLLAAPDEIGAKGELEWKEGWKWDRQRIVGRSRALWRQLRPAGLDLMQSVEADRIFVRHAAESHGVPRTGFTPEEMLDFRERLSECPEAYFSGGGWSSQNRDIVASGWRELEYLAAGTLLMETRISLIRGGLALERYRLLEGRHPTTLSDLVPPCMSAVPLDPFDGTPLRYRLQADGSPQLWSIGPDLVDEGGLPHRDRSKGDTVWITRPIPGFSKSDLNR